MQRTTLSGMIVSLLLFCCGGVLLASEADELRERAKALRKKASISAEQGKPDQAERLERESAELLEAAERLDLKTKGSGEPGIDKEVRHLKDRLQDLRAKEQKMREANAPEKEMAEVREQVAGTERELHTIHAHQVGQGKLPAEFHAQAEKLEAASRRIHHLRVAHYDHKEYQRNPGRYFADFSCQQPWHHKQQQPKRFVNHLNQQQWRHLHGNDQAEDRTQQNRCPHRAKDRSEALALRELPLASQLSSTLSAEQCHQDNRYEDHDVENVGKVQRVHEQFALADSRQGQATFDSLPL